MVQAREQARPTVTEQERAQKRVLVHTDAGKTAALEADRDVAAVPVSQARFKWIAGKRRPISKVLAGYADTAAAATRTGQSTMVVFRISPSGEAEIVPSSELAAAQPAVTPPEGDPLDIALAAAKARGQAKVADILKGEDMLSARAFGPLIGASHETVNAMRKRFELLGLEGATRGVRYPRWQVSEAGLPLPGLPQLFEILGPQPWTVYRFLRTAQAELGGRTALEALRAGEVEAVLGVAQNQVAGHFA